ncbi:MAG: helix-turn-helix transcriptional regulator [Thermohalobaculum sp.]
MSAHFHEVALIEVRTVAAMIEISPSTVWRRVADGTLPKPCRIGGLTRWSRPEVEAAINAKLAERGGTPEPEAA